MGRRNEGRKKSRKKERVDRRHKERNDGRKVAHSREFFFLLNSNPRKLCTQAPRFLLLKPEGKPRCCVNYRKNQ